MKTCPGCDSLLPATPDYWHRNRNRRDGLDFYCKECRRQRWRDMPWEKRRRRYDYFCEVYYPSHRDLVMDHVRARRARLKAAQT